MRQYLLVVIGMAIKHKQSTHTAGNHLNGLLAERSHLLESFELCSRRDSIEDSLSFFQIYSLSFIYFVTFGCNFRTYSRSERAYQYQASRKQHSPRRQMYKAFKEVLFSREQAQVKLSIASLQDCSQNWLTPRLQQKRALSQYPSAILNQFIDQEKFVSLCITKPNPQWNSGLLSFRWRSLSQSLINIFWNCSSCQVYFSRSAQTSFFDPFSFSDYKSLRMASLNFFFAASCFAVSMFSRVSVIFGSQLSLNITIGLSAFALYFRSYQFSCSDSCQQSCLADVYLAFQNSCFSALLGGIIRLLLNCVLFVSASKSLRRSFTQDIKLLNFLWYRTTSLYSGSSLSYQFYSFKTKLISLPFKSDEIKGTRSLFRISLVAQESLGSNYQRRSISLLSKTSMQLLIFLTEDCASYMHYLNRFWPIACTLFLNS